MITPVARFLSKKIAEYLSAPRGGYQPFSITPTQKLVSILQPADVLLVEGDKRISTAIKYLTQSTWSHAAIYVGDIFHEKDATKPRHRLIETDLSTGAITAPLEKYAPYNTRICRPVGLSQHDKKMVVQFMVRSLGSSYDLKNVLDLARYLLPIPPVPSVWRKKMLKLGSGNPTQAICSSLIAMAFHSISYPILPYIKDAKKRQTHGEHHVPQKTYRRKHYSLFTPKDFDLSPYFDVIKPTVVSGFNYKSMVWEDAALPQHNFTSTS